LDADAAHRFYATRASDASKQRDENQRPHDGLDQPQVNGRNDRYFRRLRETRREDSEQESGGHPEKNPTGQREPLQRSPHFSFWRSTSRNSIFGGRIRLMECD